MTAAAATDSLLGRLARQWSDVAVDDLPAEVVEVGRHCVLDWLACALAGSGEPLAHLLRDELPSAGAAGAATVVGTDRRADARNAALVNGAAGHALDFDDTHQLMPGHPTVPVLPAALAVAEELDLSGERLLAAFVVGVEVECRVGALLGPGHYRAGWHATGTIGTFGAAAAVSQLLGLDAERTTHALALAGTQAAGLKATFGTMGKPLHAGKAASDGLLAARLAARGYTGNPSVLEADQGLAAAAGGVTPDPARLDRLDGRWAIRDTLFKYHAACYLAHAAINAALALADQVAVDDIERVEVHVAPDLLHVCNIAEPATGLEGKFSLRATTAMALLGDDTTDTAAYSDERMGDGDLVALRDRVVVVPEEGRVQTQSHVVVTARNGDRLSAEDDTGRPAADLDLQWERLSSKFRSLASPVLGDAGAEKLRTAVAGLAPARTIARSAAR
ncbi:MAG TPA: MmgE/PrpD family protein [Acidimicrobiales bacterium]|jgi:2-methylcitrate dehydratase PrpD|nr:MmgE/PrpD family protein [Acidimicrobiales bacterium]